MRFEVKKKEVFENYPVVLSVGYGRLWSLLRFTPPFGYIVDKYGWRADVYEIDSNTAIVTGYAPFGNVKVSDADAFPWNAKAEEICIDDPEGAEAEVQRLLHRFAEFIVEKKGCNI